MNNKEILELAIKQAIENGYYEWKEDQAELVKRYIPTMMTPVFSEDKQYWEHRMETPYQIIFNHDFAKCFWGEECIDGCDNKWCESGIHDGMKTWEYHLQIMVISEDPISYLEQFLNIKK